MAPFSFSKPISEQGYIFEKPEVKRFAERMVRVSGKGYSWNDFLGFAKEFKGLVDKYDPKDKDLHDGIFQTLDRVKDGSWNAAFNLLIHVLVHPGVNTSFWNNPVAHKWVEKFLKPEEIKDAIQDLRQKLGA
jgi:hypothetical protein